MRKSRKRCGCKTRESGIKSPSYTIPRAADPKGDSRPEPRRGDEGREPESPGPSAGSDLEQRAHPGSAPSTPRGPRSIPTGRRGHPGKGAYPLPSTERGFRYYPHGSDSSSLWAALPPLRQTSSHCTQSPRPGPVFKGFCPRRRRLHSPAARPSWSLLSQQPSSYSSRHTGPGPPRFPAGSRG